MRNRLSTSPLSDPLSFAENLEIYECENFLLEGAVVSPQMAYWAAHTMHFLFQVRGENPYSASEAFPAIQRMIADGLEASGFSTQAERARREINEKGLNQEIIRQYTEETPLYSEVNHLLRQGHRGTSVARHPLVPWISHLNAILRNEDEHLEPSFRGASMSDETAAQYEVGLQFVWASFTSLSIREANCLGGNVLFVVTPQSPISEYGKRAPRKIASYSHFPGEEEVLLPLGCAFRVVGNRQRSDGRRQIDLALFDHW